MNKKQIIIYGKVNGKRGIVVLGQIHGTVLKGIQCHCECEHSKISHLQSEPNFIVEGCFDCGVIRTYNIYTEEVKTVFECKPYRLCPALDDSLLVMYWKNGWFISQIQWQKEIEKFHVTQSIQIVNQAIRMMCYVPKRDIVVLTSWSPKHIRAINMNDGLQLWEVSGMVAERNIDPWRLCCDPSGYFFVCDHANDRILVLDGGPSELLQVLLKEVDTGAIYNVHWHDIQPHLTVFHETAISCFKVTW